MSNVKWQDILKNNNVNDEYDAFTETFKSLYDECIPPKECMVNRRKVPLSPWITKGLLKSINKKNKLYKQYMKSPTNVNLQKFKTFKNKLNMLTRKSKRMYLYSKFEKSKSNMKETWTLINCIIGKDGLLIVMICIHWLIFFAGNTRQRMFSRHSRTR